jgi:predicted TIM-barrel fold metal-dependent hydrolase
MPSDPIAETAWLQAQADAPGSDGFPHGIVASADLMADDFVDLVATHSRHPNFRGVRQILSWASEPYMRDGKWRENFKHLGDLGFSFDMQITPDQMQDAAQLASDYPEVQIVLNHTGMPDITDDQSIEQWRLGMPLLASCENISVKISGFFDSAWTMQNMRPFVLETIELFSPSRCMFASDFPVDRLFWNFTELWMTYFEITNEFSEDEKSRMFHHNAVIFYRL